jgi:hypothetical protein
MNPAARADKEHAMGRITLNFGILLIGLGILAYVGTGMVSMTALIPAFFGLPIAVCGLASGRFGKAASAVALFLAIAGTLGTAGRLVPPALSGGLEFNTATLVQIAFALTAGTLSVLLIRGLLAGRACRGGRCGSTPCAKSGGENSG